MTSSREPAHGLTTEDLALLVSGLAVPHTVSLYACLLWGWPAIVRDETSGLTMAAAGPVDVRAMIWRAAGFGPLAPGVEVPRLRREWRVRVRAGRLIAVDTQFSPDNAVALGIDWVTAGPDGHGGADVVDPSWVDAARRLGGVVLVCADLGLTAAMSDTDLGAVVERAARGGRLLGGLAGFDDQP